MLFSSTFVSALIVSVSGGALAANIKMSPREERNVANQDRGLHDMGRFLSSLQKRGDDCKCSCMEDCRSNCAAFGGTAGSQISQGLCVLTCGDSCGCDPDQVPDDDSCD